MPTDASSLVLRAIQQAITDYLDSDAWFDRIPIVREELGDVGNMLDLSIGKLGSCVLVETPQANLQHPNIPSMFFDEVPIVISIFENVLINQSATGSQKHALDTAQVVVALLHHWNWADGVCVRAKTPTIAKVSMDPLGYQVFLASAGGFHYTHEKTLSTESNADLLTEAGVTLST